MLPGARLMTLAMNHLAEACAGAQLGAGHSETGVGVMESRVEISYQKCCSGQERMVRMVSQSVLSVCVRAQHSSRRKERKGFRSER